MASSLGAQLRQTLVCRQAEGGLVPVRASGPVRIKLRVSAHAPAKATIPDVPAEEMPPAHARAAVAAANRRARAMASAEAAAETLGSFLGLGKGGLAPGATVDLDRDQILGVLEAVWRRGDLDLERALYSHANAVTNKFCGGGVYYRGLIEFSNICQNDCSYCGIRNKQKEVWRYTMPVEEVVETAKWALENGIRNIMLQGGELVTEQRLDYLESCVRAIREETVKLDVEMKARAAVGMPAGATSIGGGTSAASAPLLAADPADAEGAKGELELGVVVSLSVGELSMEQYERLFRAGARRYLIRIETSNPDLYSALHPEPMSWHKRVECLKNLKKAGYMLGTGVMVGLPGQTLHDLAGDVMFFRDIKADMIGMGPFITQPGTPATDKWMALYPNANKNSHMKSMFDLCTAMNALVRITMGNVNISATTALQAIIPTGREIALERGANVVMPILTPTKYRESYQLYEGKPCITDTAVQCRRCLDMRLHSVGKTSAAGVWGDPASFLHPIVGLPVPHDLSSPALQAAASADFHEMGAGPWNPIRLDRLVEVPDRYPDPDNHGRGKKGGKGQAHDSHDDGDHHGHHHDHDHDHGAPAAASGTAAAATATHAQRIRGAVIGSGSGWASSSITSTPGLLRSGVRRARVVASPLRPGAAATAARPARLVAASAAAASTVGEAAGSGSNIGSSPAPSISSTTATGVPRINVGVFGVMNAGKSTLVNALAQQEACIVDSTPGTTADVKTVLMELHALGPAKLLDTAGLDEEGQLGDKKRRKALNVLKECDVAVIVVDTATLAAAKSQPGFRLSETLSWELRVMEQAVKYNVSPVLLLNVKGARPAAEVEAMLAEVHAALDPARKIPCMSLDIAGTELHERSTICANFVKEGATRSPRYGKPLPGCLPRWSLGRNAMLLMVIPMDAETPGGRLLRPQSQVQEEAIRHWATVLSVRLDLDAARGKLGPEACEAERQRFGAVVRMLELNAGPTLVVTDSQAIDVVHPWTCDRASGKPLVPITTFSIAMAYQQNGGRLDPFVDGLEALEHLQEGDRVLISEACNHNRITDACNDIGMVQIPNKLEAALGGKKLKIEHAYGREFPELEEGKMEGLKLAIHCGGCMIDAQKMQQRMKDLHEAGVPVTNYGVFFAWAAFPEALRRALEPWGVEPSAHTPSSPAQQQQQLATAVSR